MKSFLLLLLVLTTASLSLYKPKPLTTVQLRENYIERLLSYKDAKYAPYGVDTGISCSTLIRKAFVEIPGLKKEVRMDILANPCSSDDLRQGCSGKLSFVIDANNLKNLNYDEIQLGDIAIIGNEIGVHALAYIGDKKWIHSDPIAEKVIVSDIRDNDGYWFNIKARILRWSALSEDNQKNYQRMF
jgi:cell wall-associated NlpC family hydrolase